MADIEVLRGILTGLHGEWLRRMLDVGAGKPVDPEQLAFLGQQIASTVAAIQNGGN